MMMKLISFIVAVSIGSAAVHAQLVGGPYAIQPLDINGGGTTSVGGPYLLSASTGQAGGVGTIAAEPVPIPPLYKFNDGFWSSIAADCNVNGIPDDFEIASGTQCDANWNMTPDNCECDDNSPCTCNRFDIVGACEQFPITFGDVDCLGGDPELGDVICILAGYNRLCDCPNGDVCPCEGDGSIELCEVLRILDAYTGNGNPCSCARQRPQFTAHPTTK